MSIREDLKAFLDGELSADRRQEVEAALARDPQLRAELEELRGISATLAASSSSIQPSGMERTLAAVSRGPKPISFRRVAPWALAGVATVAFAAIATKSMLDVPLNRSRAEMATPSAYSPKVQGAMDAASIGEDVGAQRGMTSLSMPVANLEQATAKVQALANRHRADSTAVEHLSGSEARVDILIEPSEVPALLQELETLKSPPGESTQNLAQPEVNVQPRETPLPTKRKAGMVLVKVYLEATDPVKPSISQD